MTLGEKIELFLVNGNPDSIITAEVSNWNGKAIKIPRIEVAECKREDIQNAGVYFLFCPSSESEDDSVYIGESENVQERLIQHLRDQSEEERFFWNTAVIFTGNDLNKASIRYIEDRLVTIAKDCKRYKVLTKNTYKNTVLKEADRSSMEKFITYVRLLANTLGYKVLEPKIKSGVDNHVESEFFLSSGKDVKARAQMTSEGFVLLAGAKLNEKTNRKSLREKFSLLREKYINSDLVDGYLTTEPIVFSSPSAAADFVLGYSVSGPAMWKDKNGVALKDLESK